MFRRFAMAIALLAALPAAADTPQQLLDRYAAQARAEAASYPGPSAATGNRFFHARHGDWSCASCHTADPATPGKHVVTGKPIAPLAPAANARRFRDPARVEKWFKRNCSDTLRRACTSAEKADVLAYLLSLKGNA
jgi:mono/diheme cytochrome c family protein